MKSRVSIILALLVVFSVGLAEPLRASEREWVQTEQLSLGGKECGSSQESGPGETSNTEGDPDGWLGGQNLRPTPPIATGMELDDPDASKKTFESLYFWFLVFIGWH